MKQEIRAAQAPQAQIEAVFYQALPPEAVHIRSQVFIDEQHFVEEFDDIDQAAGHLVLFEDGRPLATGRFFPDPKDQTGQTYILGRIAVMQTDRKRGLGRRLISHLEDRAGQLGGGQARLCAQYTARAFYEKLGYLAVGQPYISEDCLHIDMEKSISKEKFKTNKANQHR